MSDESKVVVEQYNERAIVVKGNTQPYKESIKEIGGKWNPSLKAWIFPKVHLTLVEGLVNKINSGEVKAIPVKTYNNTSSSSSSSSLSSNVSFDERKFVTKEEYLAVVSRLERLEQIIANQVDFVKGTTKENKNKETKNTKEEKKIVIQDESEEEEEQPKVQRLLRQKK